MKAVCRGEVIAESLEVIELDGCTYFPPDSVNMSFLRPSEFSTFCPSKGHASYFDIQIRDLRLERAAFRYPETPERSRQIQGWVAFWCRESVEDLEICPS
ncbi:MAG: DUF427 domain-containing protein [Myxococcota bacterium]